jgi:hypothetical protein
VGKTLSVRKLALVIECVGMLAHVHSRVSITVSVPHSSDTEEVCIIPQKLLHIRPVTVEQLSYQFWAFFFSLFHMFKLAAQVVHRRCSKGTQSMLSRRQYSTLLNKRPDTRVCLEPAQGF